MSSLLPEELIVEIFTRLPTKSLIRFRSVSKWLCACIGSPSFIRLYTLRSPNKAMILHHIRREGGSFEDGDHMCTLHSKSQLSSSSSIGITAAEFPFSHSVIVGSCNGILCVHEYQNTIHLWNPSIRRKVTIHGPPSCNDRDHERIIGFGFDPTIDDYKIVKIARSSTEKGSEQRSSYVYTTKTNTWREIASPATPYTYRVSLDCLFKGSLHWLVRWKVNDSHDHYDYIMVFDMRSDVFSKIELPELSCATNEVTVINDCLAVISSDHHDCWIWARREDNNTAVSWSVAFKLNTYGLVGGERLYVFQLTTSDDLLLQDDLGRIVVYNPKSRVRSRIVELDLGDDIDSYIVGMRICVESLELLDMGSSCDQGKQITGKRRS